MFTKRVITSLLALGLLATSASSAFAHDDKNGSGKNEEKKVVKERQLDRSDDKVVRQLDRVCMQTAVEKRDNAIIAAFDAYHASAKTALLARRGALKTAWGIEDREARKEAIRKAWDDYQNAWKKERKTLHEAKKMAWKQFADERKVCGGEGEGEDHGKDKNL